MHKTDEKKMKIIVVGVVIGFIAMIVAGVILIASLFNDQPDVQKGTLGGALSSENILAPDNMTAEQVQKEYEQREEFPENAQEDLQTRVNRYLSAGQFEVLLNWLIDFRDQHKIEINDESQGEENVEYVISSLLTDLQATINLKTCDRPTEILALYANPEVLAATIAYAPISVKYEAFLDWSSLIMPAVAPSDNIYLKDVTPSNATSILTRINDGTQTKNYWDIKIYEMTLYGYLFRFTCVMNEYGYYQPYTLKSADGYCVNCFTYSDIVELFSTKDPKVSIDEVIQFSYLTEQDKETIKNLTPSYISPIDGYYLGEDGVRNDSWEIGLSLDDWKQILGTIEQPIEVKGSGEVENPDLEDPDAPSEE